MDFEVTFLTTRGNAVMRRSQRLTVLRLRNGLRIGRGTENEVQLPDIRVDLVAAAMFPRGDKFSIQAIGPSLLRVNGQNTRSAIVGTGDEILIGPYRIQLAEPPEGCATSLVVELVQPLGDALGRLMSQVGTGLGGTMFGKRAVSWAGFAIVCLLFLAAPIIGYFSGSLPALSAIPGDVSCLARVAALWEPGELANSHRFFAGNCSTCHQAAFARVPDQACLSCHGKIGGHVDAAAKTGELGGALSASSCTQCHEEHRGSRAMIIKESAFCLECHASLAERAPGITTRDVSGFASHPQFRATVVADPQGPRLDRLQLGAQPPPTDHPGIKFSHAAHLLPGGFPALNIKPMGCADCHVPEPAGQGFMAITYNDRCQHCHALVFDRQDLPWPNAKVPHGDDKGVAAAVWNFYAGKTLQGGIAETPAPPVTRRAPGAAAPTTSEAPAGNTAAWVTEKAQAALRTIVFEEKRGCAYCHFGTGPDGAFDLSNVLPVGVAPPASTTVQIVAPVVMRTRFLPHAQFDHAKHASVACEQCHAARKAETSATVMIPGIENCLGCHGAERAAQRAESSCVTCHRFHNPELGPMRPVQTAGQK